MGLFDAYMHNADVMLKICDIVICTILRCVLTYLYQDTRRNMNKPIIINILHYKNLAENDLDKYFNYFLK